MAKSFVALVVLALLLGTAKAQSFCLQFQECAVCTANAGCGWAYNATAGLCLDGNAAGPFGPGSGGSGDGWNSSSWHPWNSSSNDGWNSSSWHPWNSSSNDGWNSSSWHPWNSTSNDGWNSSSWHGWNSTSNDGWNSSSWHGWNSTSNDGWNSTNGWNSSSWHGWNSTSNDGWNSTNGWNSSSWHPWNSTSNDGWNSSSWHQWNTSGSEHSWSDSQAHNPFCQPGERESCGWAWLSTQCNNPFFVDAIVKHPGRNAATDASTSIAQVWVPAVLGAVVVLLAVVAVTVFRVKSRRGKQAHTLSLASAINEAEEPVAAA